MASDGRAEFDPSEIARVDFPTAFRGYDQDAVRRYLSRLAAAVGRAQELGLLGTVDPELDDEHLIELELEAGSLRQQVEELEGRLVEAQARLDAVPAPVAASDQPLDEAELIKLLGSETARILETARSAGADITKRAETEVAALRAETESECRSLVKEAEHALAAARTEAENIVAAAEAETAREQSRSKAEAARILEEARIDGERVRDDATAAAESEMGTARQRAAQVVGDAEALREEILGDLATRRRISREQLVVMNAARDRLAVALAAARSELDDVTSVLQRAAPAQDEIDVREPSADALSAVKATDSHRAEVADLVALLDRSRSTGTSGSAPAAAPSSDNGSNGCNGLRLGCARGQRGPRFARRQRRHAERQPRQREPVERHPPHRHQLDRHQPDRHQLDRHCCERQPDQRGLRQRRPGQRGLRQRQRSVGQRRPGVQRVGPHRFAPGRRLGERHPVVERGASGGAPSNGTLSNGSSNGSANGTAGTGTNGTATNGTVANGSRPGAGLPMEYLSVDSSASAVAVDEAPAGPMKLDDLLILADSDLGAAQDRLRPPSTHRVEDGDVDELRIIGFGGVRGGPSPLVGSGSGMMHRSAARGDLPRTTPYGGVLPTAFDGRDIALNRATPGFRRRLKRAVNDDQSEVLEALRAGRGTVTPAELPPLEHQLDVYIDALRPVLFDVVTSGAELLGCLDIPVPAVESLCLQLARHVVECLRTPSVAAIERAATTDREAILDPIRGIYRDFRNGMLPDLIEDALHEAFALGLYHAIDPSDQVLWVTDPRLDPDPICEDNSASRALPKGANFPSGHPRPLSMPGCRCLVIPAG